MVLSAIDGAIQMPDPFSLLRYIIENSTEAERTLVRTAGKPDYKAIFECLENIRHDARLLERELKTRLPT